MMEFDIGNLIYIIFVAVIFFLNLFTKSRKKEHQNRERREDGGASRPSPNKGKTFEELLEEFTGEKSKPEPQPASAPKPVAQSRPAPKSVYQEPSYPEPKYKSPKGQLKTISQIVKNQEPVRPEFARFEEFEDEEQSTSEYTEDFSDLDSAQKAFVYSEIFKRKY